MSVPGVTPTFIRAVEVWVPDRDGLLLEFGGGCYGAARRFGAQSASMCFGRGEGLPGRAWDEGRPIVLPRLDEASGFRRTALAQADGLTSGIAMPVFAGDTLKAVLLVFCGDDEHSAGAIELWHNDPAVSREMTLADGCYGRTGEAFEFISRRTSFGKGTGLPGLAWQSRLPVFMPDLGKGSRFLRADSAQKVGINRGFAFPCAARGDGTWVLAFLSALATPIARRLEIWSVEGGALYLAEGCCETDGVLAAGARPALTADDELIGRVAVDGVPRASDPLRLAALPVLREDRVASVVAWHF